MSVQDNSDGGRDRAGLAGGVVGFLHQGGEAKEEEECECGGW